ncbi:hypothetical protein GCM10025867_46760 (plasmid) [Frondihabitans sucicola]|uniref:Uncharacterized protein n=1 Tax=Frondihabitans sucicola TaxID=1268041 RepID=A0ABM8GVN5_9MICO|nr:hypothetical protein GCM10025867_46760 [Frondihabitans sucicola]
MALERDHLLEEPLLGGVGDHEDGLPVHHRQAARREVLGELAQLRLLAEGALVGVVSDLGVIGDLVLGGVDGSVEVLAGAGGVDDLEVHRDVDGERERGGVLHPLQRVRHRVGRVGEGRYAA